MASENELNWAELQQKVNQQMQQWRKEHPKATLKEIELALDQQMSLLRAKMLQSLALNTEAASSPTETGAECPNCQTPLHSRGKKSVS